MAGIALKLYTCSTTWLKLGVHHCWRVEKALQEAGIEYEPVRLPTSRKKRDAIEQVSGQRHYPVIQFEDGSIYRDSSATMAEVIRAGQLEDHHPPAPAA